MASAARGSTAAQNVFAGQELWRRNLFKKQLKNEMRNFRIIMWFIN
jgi:hypothetical protein